MPCNCKQSARSKRLSKQATAKATRLANAGVKIKKANPKKAHAKNVKSKTVKPCKCT